MSYVFTNRDMINRIIEYAVDKNSPYNRSALLCVSSNFHAVLQREHYWNELAQELEEKTRMWSLERANRMRRETTQQECRRLYTSNLAVVKQLLYFQKKSHIAGSLTCLSISCALLVLWLHNNVYSFWVSLPLHLLLCYYYRSSSSEDPTTFGVPY